MTKRAVLYARVSSDDRAKTGGANLTDQLRLCREHAEKNGYQVVAELQENDRGASGATYDLPQLSKALEMARVGQFEVLVVRELDRLARDIAKQLIVESELKRAGASIEYVLYDFPDTPEGRLNKNLRAMLAEYEREKIKQRMRRGELRKVRNGETINHGHPPFGYRNAVVNGKAVLEINEEEAKTVRLIYQWYTEGYGEQSPMSMRSITKRLTELGIPTYNDLRRMQDCTAKTISKFGRWGRSSVGSILSNETYTGTWYYGRRNWDKEDQIAVAVPVIIEREVWKRAQHRRSQNKKHAKRNRKHNYLLSGCLVCGECGRMMVGTPNYSGGKNRTLLLYYHCQAKQRGYPCGMSCYFRADHVDEIAWAWIKETAANKDAIEKSLRDYKAQRDMLSAPLRERLELITDLILKRDGQRERLLDLYLSGDFERDILTERKERIESELAGLREERKRIESQLTTQEFSEERMQSILGFADIVESGIEEAEQDFEKRRHLVEMLDLTGELSIKNGQKIVTLHCAIGETSSIVSNNSSDAGSHGRGSYCSAAQRRYRAVLCG